MAGLVMCRQGLERRLPGSDRVTECVAGQAGERSNTTVTPGWYTERLPALGAALGPLAVRREFAAIARAAGLGEWASRELRQSFVSTLSANGVRIEDSATC